MTWSELWLRAGGQVFYEFAPNHMYFQQEQGVREIELKKKHQLLVALGTLRSNDAIDNENVKENKRFN